MSNSKATGETHLIVGGTGFVGGVIARLLVARGETKVLLVDVRAPTSTQTGTTFHSGDITDAAALVELFKKLQPDVVYHTASPIAGSGKEALFERVNVEGTRNVVKACVEAKTPKLVFTSSASVIFTGDNLINADERTPFPAQPFDVYSDTKARAEKIVIEANTPASDKTGLKTCAIRPAGIFGPGDRQALPGFFGVLESGKTNVQLGNNLNLFDWTYVDNVAHAHLLAADKLHSPPYAVDSLVSVSLSTRVQSPDEVSSERIVPTSEKRAGPPGAPDFAAELPSTLTRAQRGLDGQEPMIDVKPTIKHKFDQFFHYMHPDVPSINNPIPDVHNLAEDLDDLTVAGNVFHVTNGQPIPFWDFPRALWFAYDPVKGRVDPAKVWKLPTGLSLTLASGSEWFSYFLGREANFTRFKVTFSTCTRTYNIERARRLLDYQPVVSMDEAVKRSAAWWRTQGGK